MPPLTLARLQQKFRTLIRPSIWLQRRPEGWHRFAQFALAASKMAVEDSRWTGFNRSMLGRRIIGTAIGGGDTIENQHSIFLEKGIKRLSPFGALMICTHSATGIISCEFGLKGPNTTVASGCNSGLDAISLSLQRDSFRGCRHDGDGSGRSSDHAFYRRSFLCERNSSKRMVISKAVKPFDVNGNGTVLGEGGAVILEELQNAIERRAKIYGEVLSYASGHEAYDLFEHRPYWGNRVQGDEKGDAEGSLEPADIEYINAHGNGMLRHDLNESHAIKEVFGEFACHIPVTSIKPITGQSFAVTGILQMMTCLLVMNKSVIPPTINHSVPSLRLRSGLRSESFSEECREYRPDERPWVRGKSYGSHC